MGRSSVSLLMYKTEDKIQIRLETKVEKYFNDRDAFSIRTGCV